MDDKTIEKIIDNLHDLPALPFVVSKMMEVMNDSKSSAQDIVNVISDDQALTAKILQLVNSSFYGFSEKIATISRAVVILGHYAIQNLAMGISVYKIFSKKDSVNGIIDKKRFWEHAIACAMCSRLIAQKKGLEDIEEIFIAGLLHDLGKIIFDIYMREKYQKEMDGNDSEYDKRNTEKNAMKKMYAVIGARVLEKWKLPEFHKKLIRWHYNPLTLTDNDLKEQTCIIYVANTLCKIKGHEVFPNEDIESIPIDIMQSIGLKEDDILEILLKLDTEIEIVRMFFGFEKKEKQILNEKKVILFERNQALFSMLKFALELYDCHVEKVVCSDNLYEAINKSTPDIIVVNEKETAIFEKIVDGILKKRDEAFFNIIVVEDNQLFNSKIKTFKQQNIMTIHYPFKREDIVRVIETVAQKDTM